MIELMIAITLGLMVTAVIASVFLSASKGYQEDDQFARLQENGRMALAVLRDDLAMAGFWATLPNPNDTVSSALTVCNVKLDTKRPIQIVNKPSSTIANINFPCIDTADFFYGSDVLLVTRTNHTPSAPPLSQPAYLEARTMPLGGEVKQVSAANAGASYWEYIAHIYYVRKYSVKPDDGIPTLCRKSLIKSGAGALAMQDEPLVEGIENFQIEFGYDNDDKGGIDLYSKNAPNPKLVVNARLFVLARTLAKDPSYEDTKVYALGDTALDKVKAPGQSLNYYRRVYTTVVSLRNVSNVAAYGRKLI